MLGLCSLIDKERLHGATDNTVKKQMQLQRSFGTQVVKDQHLWMKEGRSKYWAKGKVFGTGCYKPSAALRSKYFPLDWMHIGSKDFKAFRSPLWPARSPSKASQRLSVDSRPVSAPFPGI